MDPPNPDAQVIPRSEFPPTRWSMVLRLQGENDAVARTALEELCTNYWFPLYSYARRRNLSPEDAADATQGFFANLISRDSLGTLDRERGRMRSFLLGGMRNFLIQQWRDQNTLKRGRNFNLVPIDSDQAEERLLEEPQTDAPGEEAFDRAWALTMLERVMDRLEAYYVSRDRLPIFETLKGALMGDGDYGPQREAAAKLGVPEDAVRSNVHQLRARFRRYVEEEIRDTVASTADVRDELLYFCRILGGT